MSFMSRMSLPLLFAVLEAKLGPVPISEEQIRGALMTKTMSVSADADRE